MCGRRLANFNQDQGRIGATEGKPVIADRHDARTAGAHHPHGTTGTQTHFPEPMDVVRLPVDFQNCARLSGCKLVQRHDLVAVSSRLGQGGALHGRGLRDQRQIRELSVAKPTIRIETESQFLTALT
jgi:hypothetical protein